MLSFSVATVPGCFRLLLLLYMYNIEECQRVHVHTTYSSGGAILKKAEKSLVEIFEILNKLLSCA
jgi:hypothetical protein